ncbi:VPS10 domain-containing protein [Emticicia sp. SJ17W-69]|uniref:VPS10 domain-containing protein n=1 Tax=Emticicia sp. SJ17W-69 TaxID=3421657 RepID=UPI003EB77A9D
MKKILFFQIFFWVFIFCSFNIIAQRNIPVDLAQQLSGKKKFADIEKTVKDYYSEKINQRNTRQQPITEENRALKRWNRYFWYASRHLNNDGEVEDIAKRTYEFIEQERKNNQNKRATGIANGNWTSYGPHFIDKGSGRVDRISFHPTNPNTMYLSTPAGGIFKSFDADGTQGESITDYFPVLGFSGVVVDYNNPEILYALSGDGDSFTGGFVKDFGFLKYSQGIFKSTDGGSTWFLTDTLSKSKYVGWQLKQHPANPNILFACTSKGLYKTIDGGNIWKVIPIQHGTNKIDSAFVWDLEFKPNDPNTIYISYNNDTGFAKSTDEGETFTNVNTHVDCVGFLRIELAVTNTAPNNVYLLAGKGEQETNPNWNPFIGLFISTTSGNSFDKKSNSPNIFGTNKGSGGLARSQADYDMTLFVNPLNINQILVGGITIWRSDDGGSTWQEKTDWTGEFGDSDFVHADIHSIIQSPINQRIYVASDGGMSYSEDMGDTWIQKHNINASQFYNIEGNNQFNQLWGGLQDNGIVQFNDDESDNIYNYYTFDGGDGYDVLTDHTNGDNKYWTTNKSVYTNGPNFTKTITPPGDATFFKILAMNPVNENVIYVGSGMGCYKSIDKGENWVTLLGSNNCAGVLIACPNLQSRIYTGGGRQLFRIDNTTVTTLSITDSSDLAFPRNDVLISGITVDPNNANKIWVTIAGYYNHQKVFYSADAGATWQNISGSLPNLPVFCIKSDGTDNLYIGTDTGVYYRNVINGKDWIPFFNGLPKLSVTDLEIRLNSQLNYKKEILASTFGRGIWRSDTYSNCVTTLTLTDSPNGQFGYSASQTIHSSQNLKGTIGTDVIYKAGTEIRLTDGFKVTSGANLNAKISPCN